MRSKEFNKTHILTIELNIAKSRIENLEKNIKLEKERTGKIGQLKFPSYPEWLNFIQVNTYRSSLRKLYNVNKYLYLKLMSGRNV